MVGVPAEADLDGHRHRDGRSHGLDDAADAARLASERRAETHAREVIDRAPEIQIDEVGTAGFHQRGRPRHLVRLVAGQLDAETGLAGGTPNEGELAAPPLLEAAGHDHFTDQDARAEFDAQLPVGEIRPFGHRREDDRAGQRVAKRHADMLLGRRTGRPGASGATADRRPLPAVRPAFRPSAVRRRVGRRRASPSAARGHQADVRARADRRRRAPPVTP